MRQPSEYIEPFLTPTRWPNGFHQTGLLERFTSWTPKVGGTYKMSFTNFTTGKSHSFGGTYLELLPHERIRYTDKFDDPNLQAKCKQRSP